MEEKRSKAIIIFGLFELIKGAIGSYFFIWGLVDIISLNGIGELGWSFIAWIFFPGPFMLLGAIGIFTLKNWARRLTIFINWIYSCLILIGTILPFFLFNEGPLKGGIFMSLKLLITLILTMLSVIIWTRPKIKARFNKT